jgi:hypothetical protein
MAFHKHYWSWAGKVQGNTYSQEYRLKYLLSKYLSLKTALFMTTDDILLLILSLWHDSSLWWFILLLELVTHLLHRYPLNTFMLVDIFNQSVYRQSWHGLQ